MGKNTLVSWAIDVDIPLVVPNQRKLFSKLAATEFDVVAVL